MHYLYIRWESENIFSVNNRRFEIKQGNITSPVGMKENMSKRCFSADGAVLKGEVVYGKAQIHYERKRTDRRIVKAIEKHRGSCYSLLFLAIDIACFCLTVVSDATQFDPYLPLLSLAFTCLAWHVVATVLPNRWKYYAANLVTVICLISGTMGILTSPILKEQEQLICSSISPDGAYVASGYKYGDDELFRAKI